MCLKRLAPIVFIVFVVLTATASSALATATTTKAQWKAGVSSGSVSALPAGGLPLSISLGKNPTVGEKFVMETTAYEAPISIEFSKVSCVGCKITNQDEVHPGVAIGRGRLLFSGGHIGPPWNCAIEGGQVETDPLIFEAHYMEEAKWLLRISPAVGEHVFTIVPESFCWLTNLPVKGVNFGQFVNKTGVFATSQTLEFSPTISTAAGSSWFGNPTFTMRATGTLILKTAEATPYFGVE